MIGRPSSRTLMAAVLTLLLVSSFAAPVASAATVSPETPPAFPQVDGETNETNETSNATEADDEPDSAPGDVTQADRLRVSPVNFGEEWLSVEVVEDDEAYNSSGPFVMFETSEPVDAARISQQGAEARVLADGHLVRVDYDDGAAPDGKQSFYSLDLFFADGSEHTVELHAEKTSVSVSAARLEEYEDAIEHMEDAAEERGFEPSPDGVIEYQRYMEDRVDLLDNYLVEYAARLFMTLLMLLRNPLGVALGIAGVALVLMYHLKLHGWMIQKIQRDDGSARRKREALQIAYQKQRQTAEEEPLDELTEIGQIDAIYWEDALGVSSVGQLARLAAGGAHRRDGNGGLDRVHSGLEDLDPHDMRRSWLAPLLEDDRYMTPREAVSQIKAALIRMETKYAEGHRFRAARERAEHLIDELNDTNLRVSGGVE